MWIAFSACNIDENRPRKKTQLAESVNENYGNRNEERGINGNLLETKHLKGWDCCYYLTEKKNHLYLMIKTCDMRFNFNTIEKALNYLASSFSTAVVIVPNVKVNVGVIMDVCAVSGGFLTANWGSAFISTPFHLNSFYIVVVCELSYIWSDKSKISN